VGSARQRTPYHPVDFGSFFGRCVDLEIDERMTLVAFGPPRVAVDVAFGGHPNVAASAVIVGRENLQLKYFLSFSTDSSLSS
jgi:hypothetical protein